MDTYDPEPKYTDDICNIILPNIESNHYVKYLSKKLIIIDNFINIEICDKIINWIDNLTNIEKTYTNWANKPNKKKLAKKWNFPLSNQILSYVPNFINNWKKSHINDCWRFVRSNKNSSLKPHFDAKYIKNINESSFYTIMIYLSDHIDNGSLYLADEKMNIEPKKGRLVIFHQDILHEGKVNTDNKYFIRSEVMFKRVKEIENESDNIAIELYREAENLYYSNPEKSRELEREAFQLSPILENMI